MIFRRRDDILIGTFNDQILVFDPQKNLPYVMNGVAAFIFMNTDGEMKLEEIAEKVCLEYNVELYQAIEDIKAIYEEFGLKRLVNRLQ
jgi:hypothetical protein